MLGAVGNTSTREPTMPEPSELSRRERQIMDAVFALGEATVNQVVDTIPSPPTAMAVRRMMHILEEKGHLRRRESGREVIYVPRQAKDKAGRRAFERCWRRFLAALWKKRLLRICIRERTRCRPASRALIALIEQARQEHHRSHDTHDGRRVQQTPEPSRRVGGLRRNRTGNRHRHRRAYRDALCGG